MLNKKKIVPRWFSHHTTHYVVNTDWLKDFSSHISHASDGDVMVVNTKEKKEVGEEAAKRMGKDLIFKIWS